MRRSRFASRSSDGRDAIQVGERCSIVTWAALCASAGTRVTAVAPLPMTTMRLPATSMSSVHCCGWTIRPPKLSAPGNAGV